MVYNPNSVVTQSFSFDDFIFTYKLAAGITAADVGKAVELDATAAGQVKLVTNDAEIYGRLETFEDRGNGLLTGAVSRKFRGKLPANAGHGIVVGNSVRGTGAGLVEVHATHNPLNNVVIEVGTDFVVVEKL